LTIRCKETFLNKEDKMAKERSRERASELRKRAEIILAENPQTIRTMAPLDIQKLIHELNVHRIELEMQNAELRRFQLELLEARDKYLNLYDFAPTGYFTLDHNSLIVDVNLAGSELLGSEKHRLTGAQFTSSISPDSQDAFFFHHREALKTCIKGSCEIKMLKADGTTFHAQVISMAVPEKDGSINQFRTAVIDITERKQMEEERKQNIDRLLNAMEATIQAMALMSEMRDPYTAGHQLRVTHLADTIAKEMGISEDRRPAVHMSGLVHDLGKIYVPAEILTKPGRLNQIEFSMIKGHPTAGYNILKTIEPPWPIAQIVLQHHERLDGSGYPNGLSGEAIVLEARVLAVADVVEAMASHRPYRAALGIDKALEEISKNRGVLYDTKVVDACLKLFYEKGFKFKE
jgi:PAS domain S-box-containing protein